VLARSWSLDAGLRGLLIGNLPSHGHFNPVAVEKGADAFLVTADRNGGALLSPWEVFV